MSKVQLQIDILSGIIVFSLSKVYANTYMDILGAIVVQYSAAACHC